LGKERRQGKNAQAEGESGKGKAKKMQGGG